MQLTSVVAPVATPQPVATTAPVAAQPVQASAVIEEPQPSLGARLLGGMAGAQQRSVERQQLLGAISAGLGARFTQIAQSVWATLRGAAPQTTDPSAPA